MRDPEAPWLDPDWPPRKHLCKCSLCRDLLYKGDNVVFTDAGPICTACLKELDWRTFLEISGLGIETLTEDNAPQPFD